MRLRTLAGLAVTVASLALATPANAFLIQEKNGPQSATNGIALGPDGNFWVAEQYNTPTGSVVRMAPDGRVINRYTVGDEPTSVTTGPGGRVWVAVTGSKKLVWFDAAAANPTMHAIATGTDCGPVGIAAGGDGRMYLSFPSWLIDSQPHCNGDNSLLGTVADDGSGAVTTTAAAGPAFDLEVTGSRLFAPDPDNDLVRRFALGVTPGPDGTINTPGSPWGVTTMGGFVWVTEVSTGRVARFAVNAAGGSNAQEFTPAGGTLTEPYGIVAGADGRIYVTGKLSGNIARISADGSSSSFYSVPGDEVYNIVNGTDGDLWITVQDKTPILRFVNGAPRITAGAAGATATTSAAAKATVNPRGNETQVVFDYGPTIAYGNSTPPIVVPNGVDPSEVTGVLAGLTPATTYHVRARATNPEGTLMASDVTFTTPPGVVDNDKDGVSPPLDCNDANPAIHPGAIDIPGNKVDEDCSGADATFPELIATTNFLFSYKATTLTIKRIDISRLKGGETATIRCTGKRCPFKVKTYTKLKKGKRSFGRGLLRGRRLPVGGSISVRVTEAGSIGTFTSITARHKKAPKISRRCLQPGATTPSACP